MPNAPALDQFLQLLDEHAEACGDDCQAHVSCATYRVEFPNKWKGVVEVFDFHFALKQQVRDAFPEQLDKPSLGFTYVVMDFQELGTLPIGPNEVGDLLYANNRLGYTTSTAMVWGAACGGGRHLFTYVSRVVERTTTFTVALLQDLVRRLDLTSTKNIGWWSDVSLHFRVDEVSGSFAVLLSSQFTFSVMIISIIIIHRSTSEHIRCWAPSATDSSSHFASTGT